MEAVNSCAVKVTVGMSSSDEAFVVDEATDDVIVGWREANLRTRGGGRGEGLGGHICGQESRKIVSGLCNQMVALVYLYSRNIGRR